MPTPGADEVGLGEDRARRPGRARRRSATRSGPRLEKLGTPSSVSIAPTAIGLGVAGRAADRCRRPGPRCRRRRPARCRAPASAGSSGGTRCRWRSRPTTSCSRSPGWSAVAGFAVGVGHPLGGRQQGAARADAVGAHRRGHHQAGVGGDADRRRRRRCRRRSSRRCGCRGRCRRPASGCAVTKSRQATTLPARSGWPALTPVSMVPTRTPGPAQAEGAPDGGDADRREAPVARRRRPGRGSRRLSAASATRRSGVSSVDRLDGRVGGHLADLVGRAAEGDRVDQPEAPAPGRRCPSTTSAPGWRRRCAGARAAAPGGGRRSARRPPGGRRVAMTAIRSAGAAASRRVLERRRLAPRRRCGERRERRRASVIATRVPAIRRPCRPLGLRPARDHSNPFRSDRSVQPSFRHPAGPS